MNDNATFRFSLVIDSDLGEELCKFKNNESCNTHIVEKILHCYKNYPVFTTSDLLQKYYYDFPTILNTVLSNNVTPLRIDIDGSSAVDIAKYTIYKVVLCNDESKKETFPYIYIGGDRIENNFTATFLSGEDRKKAKEHLKALLSNSIKISVYDKYILKSDKNGKFKNWQSFIQFCSLLPKKPLLIEYLQPANPVGNDNDNDIYTNSQQDITDKCKDWIWNISSVQPNTYSHDRYLIIDDGNNKIEVIFTSGIRYLMNSSKDFTYIVRQHKN